MSRCSDRWPDRCQLWSRDWWSHPSINRASSTDSTMELVDIRIYVYRSDVRIYATRLEKQPWHSTRGTWLGDVAGPWRLIDSMQGWANFRDERRILRRNRITSPVTTPADRMNESISPALCFEWSNECSLTSLLSAKNCDSDSDIDFHLFNIGFFYGQPLIQLY